MTNPTAHEGPALAHPNSGPSPLPAPPRPPGRRWPIALAGLALQTCLGSVYAWSYFQTPLREALGWSNDAVTSIFSTAICCLGLAAAGGGLLLQRGRLTPRLLAVTGAVLFALGHFVAAAAILHAQWALLLVGYGVVGGTGLGLAYVVPVATAARWFPDRKGLVTGLVVMGFGLGALVMSKVLAPLALHAFDGHLAATFAALGGVFLLCAPAAAWMMRNPPADSAPSAVPVGKGPPPAWGRFALLWILFFCNIFAGISLISFQSPLLQDLLRRTGSALAPDQLASAGATLIACGALCNGVGRFFWGAVSDRIGQARAFSLMFAVQIVAFAVLPRLTAPGLFGAVVCVVLLCYGGGFGVVPSFVHHLFGAARMAPLYGAALTAWSAAGVAGPKFLAWLRDHGSAQQASQTAFMACALLSAVGLVLSLLPVLRLPPAKATINPAGK